MSVESEWMVGFTWRMYADGSLVDSDEIIESVSQKRLVMSWLNEWKPGSRQRATPVASTRLSPRRRPRGSHSPIRLNGRTPSSSEPCRRAGRWSYRISSRCLKRGMLLSSIIAQRFNHAAAASGRHRAPVPSVRLGPPSLSFIR
jgi:hypothetical protein